MKSSQFYNEKTGEVRPFKILGFIVLCAGFLMIAGYAVKVIFWPAAVAERVLNPDRAIYTYEWFHQKYQTIEARKLQYQIAKDQYEQWKKSMDGREWTYPDRNENSRLLTVVSGLKMNINELIADYNARSRMLTRNIFQGKSLPKELPQFN